MADEDTENSKVIQKALVPAATEFAEASKGAGAALGRSALAVARTVEVLLSPLKPLVWGYDQVKEKFFPEVQEKLEKVPEDRRQNPDVKIAGPSIEALRFLGNDATLRDMFANLLVTSMDRATAATAHPAYVEIIKQLAPDEAKILTYFADNRDLPVIDIYRHKGKQSEYTIVARYVSTLRNVIEIQHANLIQTSLENLIRLELVYSPPMTTMLDKDVYEAIENLPEVQEIKQSMEREDGINVSFPHHIISRTQFGDQFIKACVVRPNSK